MCFCDYLVGHLNGRDDGLDVGNLRLAKQDKSILVLSLGA